MEISLSGKRAFVGGSTQGIGKGIAKILAQCGASIILGSRNEDKLKKTIEELDTSKGQEHKYIVIDFNNYDQYKDKVSSFFKDNPIDILVNNTHGPKAGCALDKELEDYEEAFKLLFMNHCNIVLSVVPYMKKNKFGRIINVSSNTIKEPQSNLVLSNTFRTALSSWSKSLATDLAPYNITVNTILTGFFETERLNTLMEIEAQNTNLTFDEVKESRIQKVPMKRFGKPEEYGYLVAFLASEYASYITGVNMPIDGGLMKAFL